MEYAGAAQAENLPVGMFEFGPKGELVGANQALADLLGFDDHQALSRFVDNRAAGLFAEPGDFEALAAAVRESGGAMDFEAVLAARDNSRIQASLWVGNGISGGGRAVVMDITRRKRVEAELKMFDFIVNTSRDFMSMIDSDFIYRAVNTTYIEHFHKSREELIGSTVAEVWGEDTFVNIIWPNISRCFQGYEIHYGAWFTFHSKGMGYYDISYYPFMGEPGRVTHAVVITRDITERKKLHDAWRKFQFIADASTDFMTLIDRDHVYEAVNRAYLRMAGRNLEDILGRSVEEVWGRELFDRNIRPRLEECFQGLTVGYAAWFDFHDQGRGYYDVVFYPYRDEAGRVSHAVVVSRDITEYKLAEEALRESEERYRAVLDGSAQGILVIDPDGKVRYANPAMRDFLGLPPHKLDGMVLEEIHPEGHPAMEPGRGLVRDVCCLTGDGKKVYADVSLAETTINGEPCTVGFYLDASERIQREADMRRREAAESAAKAKTEFFAGLSHELRTPLNSILGMADMLAESGLTPEQRKYVDILTATGGSLLSLVNEILDLTKVETGHLVLEETDFDPVAVLEKTCLAMAPQALSKDLELACSAGPDVPRDLAGDPTRLGQVLTNLMGNAIKFTSSGWVEARVESVPDGDGGIVLAFRVRDTGIGIPENKHEAVFESFIQAEAGTTRKYGGTGLGLAVCKRLVDMMGGTISLESAPGEGSAFSFTARFAPGTGGVEAPPEPDLKGVAALVADECEAGRRAVADTLAAWGAEVKTASLGEEAPEAFADVSKADRWLAVLAQPMHGPDAGALAAALAARGADMGRVILSVGPGLGSYRADWEGEGQGPVITRPVARAELAEAVEAALGRRKEPAAPAAPAPDAGQGKTPLAILLAEDNESNRMLFDFYLKGTPHSVAWAGNGRQAVQLFSGGGFDLVFMDLEMPVMGGLEAVAEMRRIEAETGASPVPVVALTSHAGQDMIDQSIEAGCTDYLAKPVKRADLLSMIAKHGCSP